MLQSKLNNCIDINFKGRITIIYQNVLMRDDKQYKIS